MPKTESADPSPKHDDRGAVVEHWVRCGKPWCGCATGGPRHGPYYLRYWREGGRRRKEYVRLDEAQKRRAACDERRSRECEGRRRLVEGRTSWRALVATLRAYERLRGGM